MSHTIEYEAKGKKTTKKELREFYKNIKDGEMERHRLEVERIEKELEAIENGNNPEGDDVEVIDETE